MDMNLKEAVKSCFRKYATFKGRARRSEYWFAYLFVWIVNMVCAYIPVVNIIVPLVLIVGNLAVGVRRLHDAGKSGWYYLWLLLPLAGAIVVLIALCSDSEGHNQYGPSPKYKDKHKKSVPTGTLFFCCTTNCSLAGSAR